MDNLFFSEKEDLNSIIKHQLDEDTIISIDKISTGCTNIVLDVKTNNNNYIFRFPRNDFFAKRIEKDVIANKFLKKTINLKTVDMNIYYDNNRPFSIHTKVEGVALTKKINFMSKQDKIKIANEIAKLFYDIHNINIKTIPDACKISLADFLIELAKVDDNYYDYSSLLQLKENELKNPVFVYGDLNIGNIILNENNDICAFIDFSFTGISDIYCDLSRISCRIDNFFMETILNKYELLINKKLDREKIEQRNKMWNYVEEQYIIYMKKYFPEIDIPVKID